MEAMRRLEQIVGSVDDGARTTGRKAGRFGDNRKQDRIASLFMAKQDLQ